MLAGPGMGSAGWQLPHKRAQAGAAYEVSVHLAVVRQGCPAAGTPGSSCRRAGALNFSDAQIKRSAHVG
jgi:hypothetical protein